MLAALLTSLVLLEPTGNVDEAIDPQEAVPEPPTLPEPPVKGPEPTPPEPVRWEAPSGCPGAQTLRRGIEQRLGRRLVADEVEVDARVSARAEGFTLELRTTVDGLTDTRTLEAAECEALADATALVVALAVDPVAVAEVLEAARAVALEDEPIAAPPLLPATSSSDSTEEAEPTAPPATPDSELGVGRDRGLEGGILRLTGGLGLGAVPGPTGALSLAGGLQWRRARLELEGSYWVPRRTDPIDGASVAVQLGTAGMRGCGQIRRDRIEAPLCAGLLVGGMRGDGDGAPNARAATGLWLALEASVGLSWWVVPRWAIAGGFSAAVPVRQPGFEVGDDPAVRLFEPSAVAGRLWLGVELRLGPRASAARRAD